MIGDPLLIAILIKKNIIQIYRSFIIQNYNKKLKSNILSAFFFCYKIKDQQSQATSWISNNNNNNKKETIN